MTEMVYGALPIRDSEPILPKWARTLDKWSIGCVLILFLIGLLLGLSMPKVVRGVRGWGRESRDRWILGKKYSLRNCLMDIGGFV